MTSQRDSFAAGFGIRADGHDPGIIFSELSEAQHGARALTACGFKHVVIFDRVTGSVVEKGRAGPATDAAREPVWRNAG